MKLCNQMETQDFFLLRCGLNREKINTKYILVITGFAVLGCLIEIVDGTILFEARGSAEVP